MQPGPNFDVGRDAGFGFVLTVEDDAVGFGGGVVVAEVAGDEGGGIDHRGQVVDVGGDVDDALADVHIALRLDPDGQAKDIGGEEDPGGLQFGPHTPHKFADGGGAGVEGVFFPVDNRPDVAIGGKADVVEVEFIEAEGGHLFGQGDVVIPDFFLERIGPAQPLAIDPGRAILPNGGPFRFVAGQGIILENDQTGDTVDIPLPGLGHQLIQRHPVGLPPLIRFDLRHQLDVALPADEAKIPLDIHHDSVQFGLGHKVEIANHQLSST